MSFKEWQTRIHEWAVRKQWRGPDSGEARPPVVDCALFMTEVAEAVEELRSNADPKHVWFSYECAFLNVKFKGLTGDQYFVLMGKNPEAKFGKPEGFGPELADIIIRICDTAEEHGIDLDFEVERKMEYNETREIRHGGKLL